MTDRAQIEGGGYFGRVTKPVQTKPFRGTGCSQKDADLRCRTPQIGVRHLKRGPRSCVTEMVDAFFGQIVSWMLIPKLVTAVVPLGA